MSRLLAALLLSAASLHATDAILLQDDFSRLPPGMFSTGVIGAQVEYHYLPLVAPKGGWAVSNFRSESSQRAWRVIDDGERRALQHTDTAAPADVAYMHNIVVTGDVLWRDRLRSTGLSSEPCEGPKCETQLTSCPWVLRTAQDDEQSPGRFQSAYKSPNCGRNTISSTTVRRPRR